MAGCAAGAGTQTAASGSASCLGTKLGELPMVSGPGGDFIVPIFFGDHVRGMILDTGAEGNVLFRATIAEEGLHETGNYQYSTIQEGVTGERRNGVANIPSLKFAGIRLTDVTMSVVGVDPPKFALLPIAGLLGTPYLSVFDVELDVPGETLSLYSRAKCAAVAPPWTGPYSTVPLTAISTNLRRRSQDVASSVNVSDAASSEANQARLLLDVQVNGHTEHALLDTGATTIVPPELADPLGLTAAPQAKPVTIRGVDGGSTQGDFRRAAELRVGDEVMRDKQIGVFPLRNFGADMLLGRDAFRGKRVFISFAQKRLFIQPSDSKP